MKTNKLPQANSFAPRLRQQTTQPPNPEAWSTAFKDWLASQSSPNTCRAYRSAWITFRKDTGLRPLDVDTAAIAAWVNAMTETGLTASTIHQRLAAISSFYKHAIRAGLCRINPVDPVPRPHHEPYSRARALDPEQARALLAAIPRNTRQGKRDFALLLLLLVTGRSLSEICQLRFGDLHSRGDQSWINWSDGDRPEPVPITVRTAIRDFLIANGQLGSIQGEEHLFTPLTNRAARLPNVFEHSWESSQPLSVTMVGRLIKKYARRAGLNPRHITPQTLRYTAAALRAQVGANPQEIANLLGYADPATADRLLRQLRVNAKPAWQKIISLIQPDN
jgi:site-specific recombinase XerD